MDVLLHLLVQALLQLVSEYSSNALSIKNNLDDDDDDDDDDIDVDVERSPVLSASKDASLVCTIFCNLF